jgi:hypothetical protein
MPDLPSVNATIMLKTPRIQIPCLPFLPHLKRLDLRTVHVMDLSNRCWIVYVFVISEPIPLRSRHLRPQQVQPEDQLAFQVLCPGTYSHHQSYCVLFLILHKVSGDWKETT